MINNKIKILYVLPTLCCGGAEMLIKNICMTLNKNKFEIGVLCGTSLDKISIIEKELKKNEIKIFNLKKRLGFNIKTILAFYNVIKKFKPDLIHTHLGTINYAILPALLCKIPIIDTIHTIPEKEVEYYPILYKIIRKIFYKFLVQSNTISKILKKKVEEFYNIKNIPYIYNGIKINSYFLDLEIKKKIRKNLKIQNNQFVLIHIGRFSNEKNHKLLIESFSNVITKIPNAVLMLVGDGELKEDIEKLVKEKNLEKNVKFLGIRKDIPELLAASDLFVLSSDWEGLPLVIIEAMAAGKPIVATEVGGVSELIKHNYNGLLVKPRNLDHLSNAILEIYKNPEKAKKMGLKSQKIAREKFDIKIITKHYENLYINLLDKNKLNTSLWKVLFLEHRLPGKFKLAFYKLGWSFDFVGKLQEKTRSKIIKNIKFEFIKSNSKPNIILVTLDTVRAQDLPMYGGKAEMPFLSKFAKYATVYKNAYSAANWTIPSHASLFTGLYPNNHNIIQEIDKLICSFLTMAEIFEKKGYNTFCLTDNGLVCKENGLARGFEYYKCPHGKFLDIKKKVNDFLPLLCKKSFFLFINLMTAHFPYIINPYFLKNENLSKDEIKKIMSFTKTLGGGIAKKFDFKKDHISSKNMWHKAYLSALNYLDFQLAKFFNELNKYNLLTNSIIIITADHGDEIFDHIIKKNEDLNFKYIQKPDDDYYIIGHHTSYNTTIKIPLIIKHLKNNKKEFNGFINNVDIFPTILDELGLNIPNGLDGISILSNKRDFIFSQNPCHLKCNVLIKNNYKLIKYNSDKFELFDLKKDPYEKNQIKNDKIRKKMLKQLYRLITKKKTLSEKLKNLDENIMKEKLKALGYI